MHTSPTPPASRRIKRARLLDAMSRWRDLRLLRIIAPAGFGKSTLAAQWMTTIPQEEATTIVLPLTSTDRDAQRFLQRLHTMLDDTASTRHIAAPSPSFEAVEALLVQHSRRVLLVLDDVHNIDHSETLTIVQRLLNEGPSNLHLALFSRTRPSLQIHQLQLAERVLTFGPDDMRFDHTEFTAFASECRLSTLDEAQLDRIEQHYAGWPAGLHLLLQALPTTLTITDAHLHISAHNVDLIEYLEHDVLRHTPEHERDFLIRTSLLPYLSASLCQAVSGCEAGKCEAMLMRIAEHNGLVISSTKPGRTVRYQVHPVLRRFLLQQLNLQLDPARSRELRRSAATALAIEGDVDSALELLLPTRIVQEDAVMSMLGDDIDAAGDLVQRAAATELWNGDPAALQRWTAHLPHAAIVARPRLAVEAAWASHHGVEYDQHHALPTMRAALAGRCIDDDLRADASLLEAIELVRHGHMEAADEHLRTARALCHDANSRTAG